MLIHACFSSYCYSCSERVEIIDTSRTSWRRFFCVWLWWHWGKYRCWRRWQDRRSIRAAKANGIWLRHLYCWRLENRLKVVEKYRHLLAIGLWLTILHLYRRHGFRNRRTDPTQIEVVIFLVCLVLICFCWFDPAGDENRVFRVTASAVGMRWRRGCITSGAASIFIWSCYDHSIGPDGFILGK